MESRIRQTAKSWYAVMDLEIIRYLREVAHTCTRLARICPHLETAHGLEEVAIDLMAKAQELERYAE